jgi:hypothetical protein
MCGLANQVPSRERSFYAIWRICRKPRVDWFNESTFKPLRKSGTKNKSGSEILFAAARNKFRR